MSKTCLCFETEAAGLLDDFPCIVVRGICDYCDTHKNDQWQKYAAATAAAYAKELLQITDAADIKSTPKAREVIDKLQGIESIARGLFMDQKQKEIFKWMSPLNPSARHHENQKIRVDDTSKWLLNDPKFLDWSLKTDHCQTLCCYGPPGAGKTIITSIVIDELEKLTTEKIGLAYIYCDYRDQKQQTTENILGSILEQLLRILPQIPDAVWKPYEERLRQRKPLGLSDVVGLLRRTCTQFIKVYVCLDALDELRGLQALLQHLHDMPLSMKIFTTGRPHVQEAVQQYFQGGQSIFIEAHESDIQLFIRHAIGGTDDMEPDAMDDKLRNDILRKLVASAKGIFLLPTLQIRSILQATTIRDREEALKTLPSDLGEAFVGTMTRIQQQPKALSEKAGKIIAWVHLAERLLTVDELLLSLAIRDGDTFLDQRGIPIKRTLLNCCYGLTVIDQETSTIRLVHYSLQEYLDWQDQIFGLTKVQWHGRIACTCLTFLNFLSTTAWNTPEQRSSTITLTSYAATQWGHHFRKSEQSGVADVSMELAKKYLFTSFKKSHRSFHLLYEVMYSHAVYPKELLDQAFPAHIVAFFGIPQIMTYLIDSGEVDVDSNDVYHWTPLSWAARNGHESVVKLLLETEKVNVAYCHW